MIDLLSLDKKDMELLMEKAGFPTFRGRQVFQWCHEKEVQSFDLMKNLPKDLKMWLTENATLGNGKKIKSIQGNDDETVKFLLEFPDNVMVETVLMSYHREKARNRNTLCLSTQSGCNLKCKFCASTINGLERNLTAGEIVEQVNFANRYLKSKNKQCVTNVVFMGMGEPLQNLDAVIKAIGILNEGKNIGMRRITVSTCGLIPEIDKLAEMKFQFTLAVSLHAPNNEIRDKLMPINRKYPVEQLITSIDNYIAKTTRRVTIEYALFKGVNDSDETAYLLAELLKGKLINVNIIPGNPVAETGLLRGEMPQVERFAEILVNQGIEAFVREPRGLDIDGACGQLRNKQINNDKNQNI
ncbi:MAG: 23S rRNA (adenine(2503)-C(2))-methyltransferase RlmN [Clostridiales bacterium]